VTRNFRLIRAGRLLTKHFVDPPAAIMPRTKCDSPPHPFLVVPLVSETSYVVWVTIDERMSPSVGWNQFLEKGRMRRSILLRLVMAAVLGASIFASVAYGLTWVQLRAGTSSALTGTRTPLK
jgi:hypothetical protein